VDTTKKENEGKTGLGIYPDGMVEHDGHVGQVLDKLKELGLEDNTKAWITNAGASSTSSCSCRRSSTSGNS
jgi:arylsulfatase A-like enzyme